MINHTLPIVIHVQPLVPIHRYKLTRKQKHTDPYIYNFTNWPIKALKEITMKYLGTIITSLAMAVAPAVADFNIYYTQKRPGFTNGYSFYDGEPSADAVLHSTIWYTSDSVWDVEGIRCNGGGCLNSEDLSNIDVLEFNTHNWSPKLHFSMMPFP